jgi:NTE family protein
MEPRPVPALGGKRVGVVGSAGGAATVALVGVARAFEEAGIRPAAISACSGSVLWAAMWAGGLNAQQMAERALSWQPEDHLGIQWAGLPRFVVSAFQGFAGLPKGRAVEHLFDRWLWRMAAGETPIPIHTVVFNLDRGRLERFGSERTPELGLGELARIAIAAPLASEAVRVEGELYVDGGAVDAFPAEPLAGLDHVFGLNVLLPSEDGAGLDQKRAGTRELARRSRSALGESLSLIEPISPDEMRELAFYELFIDRRAWPALMRRGYEATVDALRPFRKEAE